MAAPSDAPISFFFAGSCWTNNQDSNIGFALLLDGHQIGVATIWSNNPGQHRAVVPQFAPWQFTGMGNHTLELAALPGTNTDINDTFTIVLID